MRRILALLMTILLVVSSTAALAQDSEEELAERIAQLEQRLGQLDQERQAIARQIEELHKQLEDIRSAQRVPTSGWLGVSAEPVRPGLARILDLPEGVGAVVAEVVAGSPAAEAGITRNDIIIAVNGEQFRGVEGLISSIQAHRAGEEVTLRVLRRGNRADVVVTLGSRGAVVQPIEPAEDVNPDLESRMDEWIEEGADEDAEVRSMLEGMGNPADMLRQLMGEDGEMDMEGLMERLFGDNPEAGDRVREMLEGLMGGEGEDGENPLQGLLERLLGGNEDEEPSETPERPDPAVGQMNDLLSDLLGEEIESDEPEPADDDDEEPVEENEPDVQAPVTTDPTEDLINDILGEEEEHECDGDCGGDCENCHGHEHSETEAPRAFIGISIRPVAAQDGLDVEGVMITSVVKDGPAGEVLLPGDVITAIDGTTVTCPGTLAEVMQGFNPGDKADFTVIRAGEEINVRVTFGERE